MQIQDDCYLNVLDFIQWILFEECTKQTYEISVLIKTITGNVY